MAGTDGNKGMMGVVLGCLLGAVLVVGGLAAAGVFDDDPGIHMDKGGMEIDLPDEIHIGDKKK